MKIEVFREIGYMIEATAILMVMAASGYLVFYLIGG